MPNNENQNEVQDKDKLSQIRFETTLGTFDVELEHAKASITVNNFLNLVDDGYYENLIFHRVIQGFVIQAGGYTMEMDYKEGQRTIINEAGNGLSNLTGTIAMARTSDPNSANAQFYINTADNIALDRSPNNAGYTVFGRVIRGMDVVFSIAKVPTHTLNGMSDVPIEPVVILQASRLDK